MKEIVTAYCACVMCCGPDAPRPTASGRWPTAGVSVAAPPRVPFGTWVEIRFGDGTPPMVRRVDDRTARRFSARWDVFIQNHQAAAKFGKRHATIRIIRR